MAHYALLNNENVVVQVITGIDENNTEDLPEGFSSWEDYYANHNSLACKRTSYNTQGNQHKLDGTPYRGNYAGIGYSYDLENDVFIPPKPYDSWTLNETTWLWEPPVEFPNDGTRYVWNENITSWESLNG